MNPVRANTKISGILIFVGFIAGILSVAPVVDSTEYLSRAAENSNQVTLPMPQFEALLKENAPENFNWKIDVLDNKGLEYTFKELNLK